MFAFAGFARGGAIQPGASPGFPPFVIPIFESPDPPEPPIGPPEVIPFVTPNPVLPGFLVLLEPFIELGHTPNPQNPNDWSDIVEFTQGVQHFFYSDPFDPALVSRVLGSPTGFVSLIESGPPTIHAPIPQPGNMYQIFSDIIPEPASVGIGVAGAIGLMLRRRR